MGGACNDGIWREERNDGVWREGHVVMVAYGGRGVLCIESGRVKAGSSQLGSRGSDAIPTHH